MRSRGLGALLALLAFGAACAGQSTGKDPGPGRAASAAPTDRASAQRTPVAQRAAVRSPAQIRRLYRQCPDAAAAPSPGSDREPVVNVGYAAIGKYYTHGEVRPRCLLWSGDGASDAVGLRWKSWGGLTATADGYGQQYRPQGGKYKALVPLQVRLGDRGYCNGVLSYRRVFMRKARSPSDVALPHWDSGWGFCKPSDRHK